MALCYPLSSVLMILISWLYEEYSYPFVVMLWSVSVSGRFYNTCIYTLGFIKFETKFRS